jgi:hypothetical protein
LETIVQKKVGRRVEEWWLKLINNLFALF